MAESSPVNKKLTLEDSFSNVLDKFIQKLDSAANAAAAFVENIDKMSAATANMTNGYQAAGDTAAASSDKITKGLDEIIARLDTLNASNSKISETLGTTPPKIDNISAKCDTLISKTEAINGSVVNGSNTITASVNAIDEKLTITGTDGGEAMTSVGTAAGTAASGGLGQMLTTLIRIVSSLGLLTLGAKSVKRAITEESYGTRLNTIFGDAGGTEVNNWIKQYATSVGRSYSDIQSTFTGFSKLTSSGEYMRKLTELSQRLSWFTDSKDITTMSSSIMQVFATGITRTLATQLKIPKAVLEQFNVAEYAKAGDVEKFTEALSNAADAAGLTEAAYEKMINTTESKWMKFKTGWQNAFSSAAAVFNTKFNPALERFNAWMDSTKGEKFFARLSVVFEGAGVLLGKLLDKLSDFLDYLADNFATVVQTATGALALLAAMLITTKLSALAADKEVLLVVGALVLLYQICQTFGEGKTGNSVGGFLAVMSGAFAVFYNIIALVYNSLASLINFFANLNNPIAALKNRLFDLAYDALTAFGIVASFIDGIFGSKINSSIDASLNTLQSFIDKNAEEGNINKTKKLEYKNITDVVNEAYNTGSGLGNKIDEFTEALKGGTTSDLIDSLVSLSGGGVPVTVTNDITLDDESVKMLTDLAERQYMYKINDSTFAPQINVYTQGKNSEDSRNAYEIADAIAAILTEQSAAHTADVYE